VDENSHGLEVPSRNLPVGPEDSPKTISIAGLWSGDWQVKTSPNAKRATGPRH